MTDLPPVDPKKNRSSHLARLRMSLAAIFGFLGLSILFLASCSTLITEQRVSRRPTINQQKITRARLQITNRCPQSHRFRVISDIRDPRFKQQTDAILIGATSTKTIDVLFDASGSKSNGKAVVECLDCKKAEGCFQNRDELAIQMTAVEPTPLKRGKVPSVSTRFSSGISTQSGANDVGIIPQNSGGCPVGSDHIYISMDDEDNHKFGSQNTSSVSGWTGDISRYSTGTTFGFCRVDGNRFHPHFQSDYAVLLLGSTCPAGSVRIERVFDNEDNAPQSNWSSGDIGPNSIRYDAKFTGFPFDTKMSFCFFRASPFGMGSFPNLSVPYGVFAAPSSAWFATGTVHTDDEDRKNNFDSTSSNVAGSNLVDLFAQIIYGTEAGTPLAGKNTNLLVAKVTNNTDCIHPCPYLGSYDGANCWVGKPPPGTNAIIKSSPFLQRKLYWTPVTGNCPTWYDGAGGGCYMRTIPPYTRPFIWSNMWYVEPVCRP